MLKKLILLIAQLLIIIITLAQAPISGQNILPQVGDEITMTYLDTAGINIEGAGPNDQKIWDFSEANLLSSISPTTTFYSDPVGSAYELENPQSNLLLTFSDTPDTIYASVTSTSFSTKSNYDTMFFINYGNDSLLYYSFPLSLDNTYSCNYSGNGTIYMGNYEIQIYDGLLESQVDSYGTLLTPDGTSYESVYRVKTNYTYSSSIIILGQENIQPTATGEIYNWFHEDFTCPIITYQLNNGSSSDSVQFSFQNLNPLNINNNNSSFSTFLEFEIFPNPVQDFLELCNIPDNTIIKIYDIQGNLVKYSLCNDDKIFVGDIKPGEYLIHAKRYDTTIGVKKFIKN
ncbi:MAG: T9SS type A sorting domain-containing protein [Bacteroidales bacterium]|nr:T9SS type A sorting domain-containing protein [Bacteroidales bacterium]